MNEKVLGSQVAKLLENLSQELGVRQRVSRSPGGPDLLVSLDGGEPKARLAVELCANPRMASILHAADQAERYAGAKGAIPVVALPRVSPRIRNALRERRIGYISLDGEISLRGKGLLIERQAAPDPAGPQRQLASSLFADKSSLLLRYLFAREAVSIGVRELAQELRISPGLVSRLMSRLRDDGHLVEQNRSINLVGRDALLADWGEFYRRRARGQRERRFYLHARDVESVLRRFADLKHDSARPQWGLSFQAGASLVEAHAYYSEVHVLMAAHSWDDGIESFRQALGLEPAKSEANVVFVQPYYDESWSYGLRLIGGLPVVSDLQLFLDLSVYPRRGAEQAERIRERILHVGDEEAHL